jgi:signal transduction histidine kinase
VLTDLGFLAAMRAYLIDVERRGHIRCALATTLSDLQIADDRATALFRILQEALTNVIRHAEARQVDVELDADDTTVRLLVRDDGRGIPAAEARNPRALGLIGMHDRALLFGGHVTVTGAPGEGTTVAVSMPMVEPAA